MNTSDQKGFSLVEVLLIIIVVILLGGAGWLIYSRQHKTSPSTSTNTTQKSNTSSTPDARTQIANLGVSFVAPSSSKGLKFYGETKDGGETTVYVTNDAVNAAFEKCRSETPASQRLDADSYSNFGTVSKISGTYDPNALNAGANIGTTKQFDGFYIQTTTHNGITCTSTNLATQQAWLTTFKDAFKEFNQALNNSLQVN